MNDLTEETKEILEEETPETTEEETAEATEEVTQEAAAEAEETEEDQEVAKLKAKIKELEDQSLRQIAEFQNFRNRTEREKAAMFDLGAKNVIEKMLPVVDNFERGLASIPEADKEGAVAEGMAKIYKQLMTELDNLGVKPIEAKGAEFNPDFHNAVMQVENDELESGTVAEELQKGYTYHDTVVRHSMVSVVS